MPRILAELKARGYRIVHVVPAGPQNPATPTEPQDWLMHLPSENVAISRWPRIPNFVFAGAGALPAPSLSDLDWRDEQSMAFAEDRSKSSGRSVPLPRQAPWPRLAALAPDEGATVLAAPAPGVFEIQEGLPAARVARLGQ